jgi:hypothetical protein
MTHFEMGHTPGESPMADRPDMSRRSDWPRIRADLEQKLATIVQEFIANGSLEPDALRAFARELSSVGRDLDHLDAVAAKVRQRDRRSP